MSKPNGYIIYRGPSMLDGQPIVAIATGFSKGSTNSKTGGGLIQTWILADGVEPHKAIHTGQDSTVCGDCPHRGRIVDGKNVGRSCYVTTFQAPLTVYKAYKRGRYEHLDTADAFEGRGVRIGRYGDPAAVPEYVWQSITARASYWTGYTHQWRDFPELAPYCMASCDSPADHAAARLMGFRAFRVSADGARLRDEIVCPASAEAGHRTTCDACKLCMGSTSRSRKHITIMAHGAGARNFAA